MKKGYYIHFQGRQSIGVSKKIDMQIEELGRGFDMQEIAVETPVRSLAWRVLGLFPVASITRDYKAALEQMDDPDFLYVRRTVADREYLHFWKQVKERYPNCRILIELFTYPYDKDDFGKWNAWPFYLKELLYRPRLKKYVDRFVTYTDDKEIFGIPTIRSANGINVDSVPQIAGAFQDGQINMIGVAFMQRHHGYERIIEGMREYYDGGQTPELKIRLRLGGRRSRCIRNWWKNIIWRNTSSSIPRCRGKNWTSCMMTVIWHWYPSGCTRRDFTVSWERSNPENALPRECR